MIYTKDLANNYDVETTTLGEYLNDEVDFLKIGEPIKALPANIGDPDVDSYLCIMPATILSDLYEEYGQRLLESNVRTFLQFGGKVNKGIRETLLNKPDNFFAYNNGLTVTSKKLMACLLSVELSSIEVS